MEYKGTTYKDFLEKHSSLLKGKERDSCIFSKIKEKKNKEFFKYRGVYVLVDEEKDEVVYIGSSYTRDLRKRLLQYQQKKGSGNTTLRSDLIWGKRATKSKVDEYILKLKIYSFEDHCLEYELIENTEGLVNYIGRKKIQKTSAKKAKKAK